MLDGYKHSQKFDSTVFRSFTSPKHGLVCVGASKHVEVSWFKYWVGFDPTVQVSIMLAEEYVSDL